MPHELPKYKNRLPVEGEPGHESSPIRYRHSGVLSDEVAAQALGVHISSTSRLPPQEESAWGAIAVIVAIALLCFTVGHTLGTIHHAKQVEGQ